MSDLTKDELQKVLARIRKLHAKAESCREIGSEAEAQAFAAAVQKTLAKYKLGMDAVELVEQEKSEPIGQTEVDLKQSRRRVAWLEKLASVVARAHFCRILVVSGSSRVYFVGRPTDRQIAEYVFSTLAGFAEREAGRAYRKHKQSGAWDTKGFRPAFLLGFVLRIQERYKAEEAALKVEVQQSGMSLVRLDDAHKAVELHMRRMGTTRAAGVGRGMGRNGSGLAAGRAAGDRANIRGTGVGNGASGQRALGA